MHSLDEISDNNFYDLYVNGLYVLSINVCLCAIHGLQDCFVTGMKRFSINVHPRDVRQPLDLILESGLPDMNVLRSDSSLNGPNGLNCLGPKSAQ